MNAAPDVIAAAKDWIGRGFTIVAVRPDKKPWGNEDDGKNWRRRFSEGEIIARLKSHRCVAIGFLGGALNHNIVPIDFDTSDGEQWWRSSCEAAGIDPDDFPTVTTPGKILADGTRRAPGKHRYVHDHRGTLGNSQGELRPLGIDVRGNGHAMLPPSPHPDGGHYQWVPRHAFDDFDTVPACPDFVYDAIDRPKKPKAEKPTNGHARPDEAAERYCRAALEGERHELAHTPEGRRGSTLNKAAFALGTLAHYGAYTKAEVRATLFAACEFNGLLAHDGQKEIDRIFENGWNDGLEQPREILEGDNNRRRDERTRDSNTKRDDTTQPLPIVTYAEAKPEIDAPYLIKGWQLAGELSAIIGEPGCGKTFLGLDMDAHSAAGRDWFGNRCRQTAVVYVAAEGGMAIFNRIEAMKKRLGFDDSLPLAIIPAGLDLAANRTDADALIAAVQRAGEMFQRPVGKITIDTVSRVLAGADENSPEGMGALIRNIDRIRAATNAHVTLIHHAPKDGGKGKGGRGHSSLWGAIDTEIDVDRDATSKIATASLWKQRNGIEGLTVNFKLEAVPLGTDGDGDTVSSCVIVPASAQERAEAHAKMSAPCAIALASLRLAIEEGGEIPPALGVCGCAVQGVRPQE
jgi:hypothetical protein